MKGPVERIKELIPNLPEKDIPLGYKFLEKRDFDSLQSLINSDIYKLRSLNKNNFTEELSNKLEELNKLKLETDEYYSLILGDSDDEDYESDYLDLY